MRIRETMTVEQESTKDILCNRCGESTRDALGNFECARATEFWGFTSGKDTYEAEWHLCEACCDAVTADFKIPVRRTSSVFCDSLDDEDAA